MRHNRFIICILVIVLLSFSLISCGKQVDTTATTKVAEAATSKYPDIVKLTLDGERKGSDIIFYGTTNLPDGVLLAYEVSLPETLLEEEYFWEEGRLTIKDGKYSGKISNVPEGKGKAEIWVAFQTILGTDVEDKQPQGVMDKYGELGEKMKGDNVTVFEFEDGDFKTIELIINR